MLVAFAPGGGSVTLVTMDRLAGLGPGWPSAVEAVVTGRAVVAGFAAGCVLAAGGRRVLVGFLAGLAGGELQAARPMIPSSRVAVASRDWLLPAKAAVGCCTALSIMPSVHRSAIDCRCLCCCTLVSPVPPTRVAKRRRPNRCGSSVALNDASRYHLIGIGRMSRRCCEIPAVAAERAMTRARPAQRVSRR